MLILILFIKEHIETTWVPKDGGTYSIMYGIVIEWNIIHLSIIYFPKCSE